MVAALNLSGYTNGQYQFGSASDKKEDRQRYSLLCNHAEVDIVTTSSDGVGTDVLPLVEIFKMTTFAKTILQLEETDKEANRTKRAKSDSFHP